MPEKISEDVLSIRLDFDQFDKINKSSVDKGGFPIVSCIQFYKACGLYDVIEEYYKDKTDEQPCPIDNIKCNFYTLQRIKNYINRIWAVYNISIDGDNHIIWTNTRHDPRTHEKTLKAIVRNSVNQDFVTYCPGLDDELEDNILVFRIYHIKPNDDDVIGVISNE